jgi:hypothetical protein
MSSRNGDKSRFHRERKQKIARRARNRTRLSSLPKQTNSPASVSGAAPKAVSV